MAGRVTRKKKAVASVVAVPPLVRYQPDEDPKRKHHWDLDEPGFVELAPGHLVGKCPRGLPLDIAEQLLRAGVGYNPEGWRNEWVERI